MAPEEIANLLKANFGDAVLETAMNTTHPAVVIAPASWREIALFLQREARLQMNMLRCISGVDRLAAGYIEVVYDFISMQPGGSGGCWTGNTLIAIKVRVPRDGGHLPTVSDLWPAADWHEREVYDMFGVSFDKHPDMRRILCPDDWVGYPLRKDYEYPLEYHGIPATTEFGQKSPRH